MELFLFNKALFKYYSSIQTFVEEQVKNTEIGNETMPVYEYLVIGDRFESFIKLMKISFWMNDEPGIVCSLINRMKGI